MFSLPPFSYIPALFVGLEQSLGVTITSHFLFSFNFILFFFLFLCVTEKKAYLFHKAVVVITHLSHILLVQNGGGHPSDIKCKTLTYTFGEDYYLKPCRRCKFIKMIFLKQKRNHYQNFTFFNHWGRND